MRLLVVTQAVDRNDPILGFFHRWLANLAPRFETIEAICLYEGAHALPENVRVHSLGKERGTRGRIVYAVRFFRLLWRLRGSYDAVFVHMNQEYVLLAGWWWRITRIPVHLWRNHYAGSIFTDIAALFCAKVYYTSRASYTARFKHAVLMPVGVDTDFFRARGQRTVGSVLSLGRIAPSKRLEMLIDALGILRATGTVFTCSIYGDALLQDEPYLQTLREMITSRGLGDTVRFHSGVPNDMTPAIYGAHQIFVNASLSGMYDKTILEAAACGCYVLAASEDFKRDAGESFFFTDPEDLARKFAGAFMAGQDASTQMRTIASAHSLDMLIDRLAEHII